MGRQNAHVVGIAIRWHSVHGYRTHGIAVCCWNSKETKDAYFLGMADFLCCFQFMCIHAVICEYVSVATFCTILHWSPVYGKWLLQVL